MHAQFINHQDGKQNSEPEYYFSQKELKYITGKIITKYKLPLNARCMKIIEKVSFNIVSEANYGYILIFEWTLKKNAKNAPNSVTRQVNLIEKN